MQFLCMKTTCPRHVQVPTRPRDKPALRTLTLFFSLNVVYCIRRRTERSHHG